MTGSQNSGFLPVLKCKHSGCISGYDWAQINDVSPSYQLVFDLRV